MSWRSASVGKILYGAEAGQRKDGIWPLWRAAGITPVLSLITTALALERRVIFTRCTVIAPGFHHFPGALEALKTVWTGLRCTIS